MFQLDLHSKKSIHEQIVDGIKNAIMSGKLGIDDKLPSVRDLSAQLMVNPNTIAKAFKTLESQGWIYTVSGRGCFVSGEMHVQDEALQKKLMENMEAAIIELLYMGVAREEIISKVEKITKKGGK